MMKKQINKRKKPLFIAGLIILILTVYQFTFAIDLGIWEQSTYESPFKNAEPAAVGPNGTIINNVGFSSIAVGEVKSFTFSVSAGILNEYYDFYITTNAGNAIGYSLNPTGPFTATLNPTYQVTSNTMWTSPTIYVKGLAPSNSAPIDVRSNLYVTFDVDYVSVNTPLPPSAALETSATEIPVGWKQNMRIRLQNSPNQSGTYTIVSDTASKMLFATSPGGPYAEFITVSVTTNQTGGGVSSDFYVKPTTRTNAGSTLPKIRACSSNSQMPCVPERAITILNVFNLSMDRYSNSAVLANMNVALDNNPNAAGGIRVYPEDRGVDDAGSIYRRYVRIRALLSQPLAGRTIKFKVYDVDDPSTDDPIVDPNGADGNDNRDAENPFVFVESGAKTVTAVTDVNGNAVVTLAVGKSPGDNYRVAAVMQIGSSGNAATNDVLGEVSISGEQLRYQTYALSDLSSGVSDAAVSTKLLTVWRSLHLERDSMGVVNDNHATGIVTSVEVLNPAPAGLTKITLAPSNESLFDGKRFESGTIKLYRETPGSPTYQNIYVRTPGYAVIAVGELPQVFVGSEFIIWDDDDMDANYLEPGDEGTDVPQPQTGWIADTDDPNLNKLAPAYVRPKYDLIGTDNSLPFILNVPKADSTAAFSRSAEYLSMTKIDYKVFRSNPNYWVSYMINAYQTDIAQDFDADDDYSINGFDGYLGIANRNVGAITFLETRVDAYDHHISYEGQIGYAFDEDLRYTPAHEVAHLLHTKNDDGGFMSKDNDRFSPTSLNLIRNSRLPTTGELPFRPRR